MFTIVGRSSSHFTRVTRIFALELGIEAALRVVPNLASASIDVYGGNPALRVPALHAPSGTWFGALSVCREFARQAPVERRVIWPESLDCALLANAQELTVQAMSSEVSLIMGGSVKGAPVTTSPVLDSSVLGGAGGSRDAELSQAYRDKLRTSLLGSLAWLDRNVDAALVLLPPRDLSYLEVTLFCLVAHLEFRELVPLAEYARLRSFNQRFAERASARATPFRFDVPS